MESQIKAQVENFKKEMDELVAYQGKLREAIKKMKTDLITAQKKIDFNDGAIQAFNAVVAEMTKGKDVVLPAGELQAHDSTVEASA